MREATEGTLLRKRVKKAYIAGWRNALSGLQARICRRISAAPSGKIKLNAAGALTVAVTQRFQQAASRLECAKAVVTRICPVSAKQFVCNREFLRVFRRTYAARRFGKANGFGNAHVADHFIMMRALSVAFTGTLPVEVLMKSHRL